jgi:nucleoside-diphosphate-sugar epimerase
MSEMEPVNIFGGRGYIGSNYVSMFPNCVVNDRNDYVPKTNNILYFISTVDNYNVFSNPHLDIDTNLSTLIDVLSNIQDKENTVFNFISSWFVYGDTDLPATEQSNCNPKGFYSITKRCAEQLLISYCETFKIKYRILRLANVVGGKDTKASAKKNALTYMIQQLKNNEPVKLYDGGDLIRDFIHVEDCVRAINLVVEKGELNTIYNIGNGIPIKLNQIISDVKWLTNSKSELYFIQTPEFHKLVQVKSMYIDNTKLKSLGYSSKYGILGMLKELL